MCINNSYCLVPNVKPITHTDQRCSDYQSMLPATGESTANPVFAITFVIFM